ncbi:MAG: hypothetical protein U5L04_10310 [Trueperaceae bacterium]|nr:hypothetical protein [Trueperaceae bacterium]
MPSFDPTARAPTTSATSTTTTRTPATASATTTTTTAPAKAEPAPPTEPETAFPTPSESAFGDALPDDFYDDPTLDTAPTKPRKLDIDSVDDADSGDFDRLGDDVPDDRPGELHGDVRNEPGREGGGLEHHPRFAALQSLFPGHVVEVQPLHTKKKRGADANDADADDTDDPGHDASDLTENDVADALD